MPRFSVIGSFLSQARCSTGASGRVLFLAHAKAAHAPAGTRLTAATDLVLELGAPAGMILRPTMLIGPFFAAQRAAIPTPASILVRRAPADVAGDLDTTVRATLERQPFECAQALLSRVATRFRLGA